MAPPWRPFVGWCSAAEPRYDSYPRPWRRLVGRRARVVQNGADLDRVERAIAGRTRSRTALAFRLVSVGRLEKVKDPLDALAAFRRLDDTRKPSDVRWRGVLSKPGSAAAIDARRGRRADRADRPGSRDDVFVRCAEADLFVSTSLGEGLPVAVIEAMATGCPAVLSDIPPHRELAAGAEFIPIVRPRAIRRASPVRSAASSDMPGRGTAGDRRALPQPRPGASFGLATMHAALRDGVSRAHMIVEFIGCDGAGKTTLAQMVRDRGVWGERAVSMPDLVLDRTVLRHVTHPTAVNVVQEACSLTRPSLVMEPPSGLSGLRRPDVRAVCNLDLRPAERDARAGAPGRDVRARQAARAEPRRPVRRGHRSHRVPLRALGGRPRSSRCRTVRLPRASARLDRARQGARPRARPSCGCPDSTGGASTWGDRQIGSSVRSAEPSTSSTSSRQPRRCVTG